MGLPGILTLGEQFDRRFRVEQLNCPGRLPIFVVFSGGEYCRQGGWDSRFDADPVSSPRTPTTDLSFQTVR